MNQGKNFFVVLSLSLIFVLCFSIGSMAAEKTNHEKILEGYEKAKNYYLQNKTFESTWDTWAAYACLGQYIQDPANGYTFKVPEETNLNKMQPGANILGLIAVGENPYNYQGRNLVQELIDGDPGQGYWSVPVFNALALEAAGAKCDDIPIDYCIGEMENLSMGPDIGGWALVAVSRHLTDEYREEAGAALETFRTGLLEKMWGNSTGSAGISMACVTLGFTALTAQGYNGYDVTRDAPWVNLEGNHDPIGVMYDNYVLEKENVGYTEQYRLVFADLYNVFYNKGNSAWLSMGVDNGKLQAQIRKANEILANPGCYTQASLNTLRKALAVAENITSDQRSQDIADYGQEYYDLYDAVRNIELNFTDVERGKWYYSDVSYVVSQGIMKGLSATEFGPNSNITRGQFVTILGRWAGINDSSAAAPVNTKFADVSPSSYYGAHVAWAVEKGITTGTSGTSFEPNANITRQDMATMIVRYAKAMGITLTASDGSLFADDGEIATYARDGVYSMKASGIINGKGDNKFEPKANATRAEAAKIIHKLMEL